MGVFFPWRITSDGLPHTQEKSVPVRTRLVVQDRILALESFFSPPPPPSSSSFSLSHLLVLLVRWRRTTMLTTTMTPATTAAAAARIIFLVIFAVVDIVGWFFLLANNIRWTTPRAGEIRTCSYKACSTESYPSPRVVFSPLLPPSSFSSPIFAFPLHWRKRGRKPTTTSLSSQPSVACAWPSLA